jgi:TadE-like protein
MINSLLKLIHKDTRGVTIIEFAFAAPALLLLLFGFFDFGYRAYALSVLQGEVQKAARDGTLEGAGGATASIDARIKTTLQRIVKNGQFTFDRRAFVSFTRAGEAEIFTDTNLNGTHDPGECYQDENGSGFWEDNAGVIGQGGARDIVVYEVTVTFKRLFPMAGLLGFSPEQSISSSSVLRNQPYGDQAIRTIVSRCN